MATSSGACNDDDASKGFPIVNVSAQFNKRC